jgi:hypothetical protein
MPHGDRIQALFGRHSIAGIDAHVGGPAAAAADAIGARAYATGSSVAFAERPDLHTAAHEAAHVIQQRAGVHLKNGVGESGDVHERHADAVADRVVRGESAEPLLDRYAADRGGASPTAGATGSAIQRQPADGTGGAGAAADATGAAGGGDAENDVSALALTPDEQRQLADDVKAGQSMGGPGVHAAHGR